MPETVNRVAEELGESREFILGKGVSSFLDRELREVETRINELEEKYGVESPSELEDRIEEGEVDEHPAWEERIEWENLEKRKEKLESLEESTGD